MMKLVIVLSFALVGNVFASDDGECSAADGQQVLNDWTHLWENSDSSFKVEFAKDILIKWVRESMVLSKWVLIDYELLSFWATQKYFFNLNYYKTDCNASTLIKNNFQ